ncbi:MAG: 2OG-Fe(II) oxygenase [Mucilaginibacter sp.]
MISITKKGLIGSKNSAIEELKSEFTKRQCIVLPQLLDNELLDKLISNIDDASFYERQHFAGNKIFATDLSVPSKNVALHQFNFLFNNTRLFRLIETITDLPGVRGFSGRIYRNLPGTSHFLDWHDDRSIPTRLIGLSINLSYQRYEGGTFQIRKKGDKKYLTEVGCTNPGDAHIFKVSHQLEHRVTEVTGNFPRTAGAGWFTSEPASLILKQ